VPSQLRVRPETTNLFGPTGELDLEAVDRERLRRIELLMTAKGSRKLQERILEECAADPIYFINTYGWTYDPRLKMLLPMLLWPKQQEYVLFVEERIRLGEEFVTVKSRDVGVTYMHCAMAVQHWRFDPGFKTTFCANKLDLVDQRGNPDSIFEKIRMFVDWLPTWMKPRGFKMQRHAKEGSLKNPENGNIISGEGGDNAGRGGRSTLYLVDEAAHVERADSVNKATSANARSRGWTSSVNGNGNLFYRFAHDGDRKVFTFKWQDDPRKDEVWAAKKRKDLTPVVFAQEYDCDFGASIEGLAIPMAWVEAARELYRRMPDEVTRFRTQKGVAGWDVGGGKAESVVVVKHSALIEPPRARIDPDGVDVAYWALDIARAANVGVLNYDSPGVGFQMGAILERATTQDVHVRGVNTGVPPTDRIWPDGRTSKEKFGNLKAELWWRAREAFNRSWLLLRHLQGDPDGIDYRADEVILLGDDDELARQLSTPKARRTERGLIMIETKEQLAKRGIRSPDRADAAVLAFHDDPVSSIYVGDL
jgi:hypothetical protein